MIFHFSPFKFLIYLIPIIFFILVSAVRIMLLTVEATRRSPTQHSTCQCHVFVYQLLKPKLIDLIATETIRY